MGRWIAYLRSTIAQQRQQAREALVPGAVRSLSADCAAGMSSCGGLPSRPDEDEGEPRRRKQRHGGDHDVCDCREQPEPHVDRIEENHEQRGHAQRHLEEQAWRSPIARSCARPSSPMRPARPPPPGRGSRARPALRRGYATSGRSRGGAAARRARSAAASGRSRDTRRQLSRCAPEISGRRVVRRPPRAPARRSRERRARACSAPVSGANDRLVSQPSATTTATSAAGHARLLFRLRSSQPATTSPTTAPITIWLVSIADPRPGIPRGARSRPVVDAPESISSSQATTSHGTSAFTRGVMFMIFDTSCSQHRARV